MKVDYEIRVVRQMIGLYCRRKEGNGRLCADCAELAAYAEHRLRHCPDGNAKGSCRHCRRHCYRPDMRDRIRKVMRFAGPRMILCHPVMAIRHLLGI